tara:strand:+ start:31776 stop:32555 length:780 start_codon:yes stop_codon:yes gene_type:complete
MCGRFAQIFQDQDLDRIGHAISWAPGGPSPIDEALLELLSDQHTRSYNIAPTQYASILHIGAHSGNGRPGKNISTTQAHFGLIPSWAKDRSRSSSMINARSETISAKPAYRDVYRSRRCIVPINGFYEWQKIPSARSKQPWYLSRADAAPLLLAGVCDTWLDPEHGHSEVDSFSLITTKANAFIEPIHHRMPVVIEPESVSQWFDPECPPRELRELLAPANDGVLCGHRISSRVNSPSNDDPTLIERDADAMPGSLWEN